MKESQRPLDSQVFTEMEVSHCFSKMLFLDNEPSELVAHFLCFHIHSNSDYAFRPDFECDFHTPELRLARGIQKNDLLSNYSPQRETTSCQHLLTQTWNPKLGDGPHVCLFGGAARIFTRRVARDFVERHAYDVEMEKILKPEQITSVLKRLAYTAVRNEIVCEHFLNSLGVSIDDIGAKVREVDQQLENESLWKNRFPELFDDDFV